jgi:DNA replication protein DnaD
MHEYGYSVNIIGEAYDVTVAAINKISLPYIGSILKEWYDAGCKSIEECRARVNIRKAANPKKANNTSQKTNKNTTAETPKYADFNSEDALMRALERSYNDADN